MEHNCEFLHRYGPYQYSGGSKGTTNLHAYTEVNAGETITFWVKARNNAKLLSDAVTFNITGPDAGK